MRVLFLTTSISSGQSGVADYTKHLANYISSKGGSVGRVALNVNSVDVEEGVDDCGLPFLSMPGFLPEKEKIDLFKNWIGKKTIDVASFQYSPYGYFYRGIPEMDSFFCFLRDQAAYTHIMMHELWLGISKDSSLKEKLIGFYQKRKTKKFLNILKPDLIHSHAAPYLYELNQLGFSSRKLPLYSNVRVVTELKTSWNSYFSKKRDKEIIRFAYFGGIPKEWKVSAFLRPLSRWLENRPKVEAWILFIGKSGLSDRELDSFCAMSTSNIKINMTGRLSSDLVSNLLNQANYGIAGAPLGLYEKSSSVATMLLHGLPIVFPRTDFVHVAVPEAKDYGFLVGDWTGQLSLNDQRKNSMKGFSFEAVAAKFLKDLELKL